MKSRKEQQLELANKVERLATRYFDVVREMQAFLVKVSAQRAADGSYPDGTQEYLGRLHGKAQRISIRVLRTRADMMELGLTTAFDDVPKSGPDALPEGW